MITSWTGLPFACGTMKSVAPRFFAISNLCVIGVDGDDALRLRHDQSLDHAQSDAAEAEDGGDGAWPHFRGIQNRADAGGDAAAEQADFVERRSRIDFRHGDFRQHGVFGKRRRAHVVQNRFAAEREARSAVGHDAFALG